MKKTFIYLVTNCYGDYNKVYIGKTVNLKEREFVHKRKYGSQIEFTIIDEINSLNRKDWKPLECYWIEQFRQWGFDIQNKNKGGSGLESWTEEINSKRLGKLGVSIIQYNLEGIFIKEWDSIKKAEKELKIKGIDGACRYKQKRAGNYVWRYKNEPLEKNFIFPKNKTKNGKKIIQKDLNGNFLKEWENQTLAGRILNIKPCSISRCCNNNRINFKKKNIAGGFVWEFK